MAKWTMPEWMEPYRDLFCNTGGNSVEELMSDKSANVANNAVRAALIVAVRSQVGLLTGMHERGLLARDLAADRKRTGQTWGEACAGVLPPKRRRKP